MPQPDAARQHCVGCGIGQRDQFGHRAPAWQRERDARTGADTVNLSSRTGTNTVNGISATLNSGDNRLAAVGPIRSSCPARHLQPRRPCWLERVRERDTEHDGLKLDAAQCVNLSVDAEVAITVTLAPA